MTLPTVVIPLPIVPYTVSVIRYTGIQLQCPGLTRLSANHSFLATFDEIQRHIACPTCGAITEVPAQYRGMP